MSEVVARKLMRGVWLTVVWIAAVTLVAVCVPTLVANHAQYRSTPLHVVAIALIGAVIAVAGLHVLRERPLGRLRHVLLLAVCLAAGASVATTPVDSLFGWQDWSALLTSWAGMTLLLDRPRWVVMFLAVCLVARFGPLIVAGRLPEAGHELIIWAVLLAYQLGILYATVLLRRIANTVVDVVTQRNEVRISEAVAEHLHRDRRERYAGLKTVPLLAGLAAGVLDPTDPEVRARCAAAAGRMRRLFAENDEVADPLLHELRACADTAERRGVRVYLATAGSYPVPPLEIRRALTEPAVLVLATAASEARVTVVGSPTLLRVNVVTTGAIPLEAPDPSTDEVAINHVTHGDHHWLEATWRFPT